MWALTRITLAFRIAADMDPRQIEMDLFINSERIKAGP